MKLKMTSALLIVKTSVYVSINNFTTSLTWSITQDSIVMHINYSTRTVAQGAGGLLQFL